MSYIGQKLYFLECPSTKIESKETTESVDITTCSPNKKRKKMEEDEKLEHESSSSSNVIL